MSFICYAHRGQHFQCHNLLGVPLSSLVDMHIMSFVRMLSTCCVALPMFAPESHTVFSGR